MQVQCNKDELSLVLQELTSVVPTTTMIPVLNNILVDINDGNLNLVSSDLEIGLTINIPCKADSNITTTVPGKLFAEIVRSLNEPIVTMEVQTDSVKILCDNSEFFINCIDPGEFPILPEVSGKAFTLKKDNLLHSYERVIPAVLTKGEGNIAYSCILLETNANEFKFVTTDGQRLILSKFWDNADFNSLHILLPPKTFNILGRIWPRDESEVQFTVSEREISFTFKTKRLVSRILEADFPAYEKVIPDNVSFSFKVDKNSLLGTLQRAYIIVRNGTKRVSLDLVSDILTVSGQDPERGWVTEKIKVIESNGGEWSGLFDAKKLIDGISGVDTEEVVIETSGPFHPLLIREPDSDNYIYVLVSLKSS